MKRLGLVTVVYQPGRLLPSEASGLDADGHVGQHEGDGLVVRDGDAERLALQRVLGGFVESAGRETRGAGGYLRNEIVFFLFWKKKGLTSGGPPVSGHCRLWTLPVPINKHPGI